jgi:signal transduction histidine kinase
MTNISPYETLVELVRKLGHDMRAPLGTIISTGDMLDEGLYDPLTPKQAKANDRIKRNGHRVVAILDDFLTYVKADAGQIDLSPKAFDPRTHLIEWCHQVKPTAEKKELAFHVTTQDSVPSTLIGDPAVIGRALVPLLWNAVTFTSQGSIWIDSDWTPENHWIIKVRDSGPGIPVEDLPHLFEPFWRGEARPQGAPAGAGLGLPLALALVKVMSGDLILEETGQQGSLFRFDLPLSIDKEGEQS